MSESLDEWGATNAGSILRAFYRAVLPDTSSTPHIPFQPETVRSSSQKARIDQSVYKNRCWLPLPDGATTGSR
jgi:hypothetical protein